MQYPSAPRLVVPGGEGAQTGVGAPVVATESDRETDDRFLESDPGDQDMLWHRLGDHAGVSVPEAIAQGFGISDADHRDIGAALRGPEILHEEPGGQLGNVQDVRLGHHQRLRDVIVRLTPTAHGRRQIRMAGLFSFTGMRYLHLFLLQ